MPRREAVTKTRMQLVLLTESYSALFACSGGQVCDLSLLLRSLRNFIPCQVSEGLLTFLVNFVVAVLMYLKISQVLDFCGVLWCCPPVTEINTDFPFLMLY